MTTTPTGRTKSVVAATGARRAAEHSGRTAPAQVAATDTGSAPAAATPSHGRRVIMIVVKTGTARARECTHRRQQAAAAATGTTSRRRAALCSQSSTSNAAATTPC